uniref:uncharacterized protein LOC109972688 n=1 Tax=Monopterus albus TaxID=43700 RepID=UPI0009B4B58B|nr:uncharacterized protein LOC109972688 [Monopterus albus]XP_020477370.1 uncharacterized protein LOC109972688 [Monopterus albus]XP_020477371.1 uncharacterized protein LOC109972688 [Monopterus albus]
MSRSSEMTSSSSNIFIIFTIFLSFIFHSSQDFEVIQPPNRMVNTDGVALISCEHTANVSSVEDVRLSSISQTNTSKLLCQKGTEDCKNIFMHLENPKKCLFILYNIGPEDMDMSYECEFTININDLHYTKRGTPTRLLQDQKEVERDRVTCPQPPPPPLQSDYFRWILIGLLVLMFLCFCVIISVLCVKVRNRNKDPENCTYVEMRKAPLPRNPPSVI